MGGSVSTVDRARARSDAIDEQIIEDSKRSKREATILMLGVPKASHITEASSTPTLIFAGSSGSEKDVLLKQMQILYKSGFTRAELKEFRPIVCANVLESAQAIVTQIKKRGLVESLEHKNRVLVDKISDYRLDATTASATISDACLSSEIAEAIYGLWKDPIVAEIIELDSGRFYLMDNASYFLGEVLRIGMPEYLPSVEDVLQARQNHTGIIETRLTMGQLSLRVIDVGSQRSERKKWIHHFEGVTAIIFCAALTDYDRVLPMEGSQSQVSESLILFESIINSRWFIKTSVILLLTKIDELKRKLPTVPLEPFFPEYTGGADVNKAVKYILWRFMQVNRARLSVYPHLSNTKDITSVRLILTAVKETILQNAMRESTKIL